MTLLILMILMILKTCFATGASHRGHQNLCMTEPEACKSKSNAIKQAIVDNGLLGKETMVTGSLIP